jgi:hypothetical protein
VNVHGSGGSCSEMLINRGEFVCKFTKKSFLCTPNFNPPLT